MSFSQQNAPCIDPLARSNRFKQPTPACWKAAETLRIGDWCLVASFDGADACVPVEAFGSEDASGALAWDSFVAGAWRGLVRPADDWSVLVAGAFESGVAAPPPVDGSGW